MGRGVRAGAGLGTGVVPRDIAQVGSGRQGEQQGGWGTTPRWAVGLNGAWGGGWGGT